MKALIFAVCLCAVSLCIGQNLVPNPSFENNTACPSSYGQTSLISNWMVPPAHTGSSDYFHGCGSGHGDVPTNYFGTQAAHSGQGYAGGFTGYTTTGFVDYREYLQVQLTSPLVAGETYQVQAYLSLPDRVSVIGDNYGFYFSQTQLTGAGNYWNFNVSPQVEVTGNFVLNHTGWDLVSGTFVASGGEQWLTIGSFRNAASTPTMPTGISGANFNHPYLYVDDVSVELVSILGVDFSYLHAEYEDGFNVLHWGTSHEENLAFFEVQRSLDGSHFDKVGEVEAGDLMGNYAFREPGTNDQPTYYYRLKGVDFDGTVHQSEIAILHGNGIPIQFSVYPTVISSQDPLQVRCLGEPGQQVEMTLLSITGSVIYHDFRQLTQVEELFRLMPQIQESGIYLLKLSTSEQEETFRLMVR